MNKEIFKVCEVETVYRSKVKPSERFKVGSSFDAFEVIKASIDIADQEHRERAYIILLNAANKVLGIQKLGDGAIGGCIIDVRLLFQTAIKTNSVNIILWHNHPSGNLKPSQEDIAISKKVKEGGKLLDINLLDHLLIDCEGNFYSMADNGDF